MRCIIRRHISAWLFFCLMASFALEAQAQSESKVQSFQIVADGQAHLTLDAPQDQNWSFLTSSNLVDWWPAGPLPPVRVDNETATYLVEIDATKPLTAYRIAYTPIASDPEPLSNLEASPTEPVVSHLPDMGMPFENEADEVEFVNGVGVSLAHVLVTFEPTTTVESFNALLTAEGLSLAGAVPVMNLGLLRRDPITSLADLEALAQRLIASGLFKTVALNLGATLPREVEEGDGFQLNSVGPQVPSLNWTWEVSGLGRGSGGNNALELSRIPQLWNWLDYGHRQKEFLGGHDVAVLEFAFSPHLDLGPNVVLGTATSRALTEREYDHGVAVTGVIAAMHNEGWIQGVTPFPDRVRGIPFPYGKDATQEYSSLFLQRMSMLLNSGGTVPKVFNFSVGIKWTSPPGFFERIWMDNLGDLWADCFETLNEKTGFSDYLVVCSAGNDSGVDARYSSPLANIACRPSLHDQAPQFLTAESLSEDRTTSWYSNYDHTRAGHAVSAGGTKVTVLDGPERYGFRTNSGTSFASPLVAGLASFLWTLEPSLTISEMKHLLLSSNTTMIVQSGERANLVDGFAAALEIDRLRQSPDLQRALVDVDDGTLDGNLRQEILHFSEDPNRIHTFDGRRGDGIVTMRDFRVFRDAWLQVIGETNYLDGPPTHFKRDLNFDGLVFDQPVSPAHPAPYATLTRTDAGQKLPESHYSRYDFNGNGLLDQDMQRSNPSLDSISPFKVDPDTPVTERSPLKGLLRDVDVLLNTAVWQQDEENVTLTGSYPTLDNSVIPPEEWTTNSISRSFVDYLWSFDLHVDMEAGNPDAASDDYLNYLYPQVIPDGLWVGSWAYPLKARSGEWEGVVTVPFGELGDFPTVSVRYKRTVGEEFHQYMVYFLPGPGEDIGLAVGFDELQCYSNTREFAAYFLEGSTYPESHEVIAKRPGSGPYTSFLVKWEDYSEEEVRNRARDFAIETLASRLKFPVALNGSPDLKPLYRYEEEPGGSGVMVDVFGIVATYNTIESR